MIFFYYYSSIDNVICHPLCVWCVSVYLHSDSYKFIYKFYSKFCFLVFHFHDIDLKLFIYLFEEPQETNSKYFKNLIFTNPYYMTELLAALSFQT